MAWSEIKFIEIKKELFNLNAIDSIITADALVYINFKVNVGNNRILSFDTSAAANDAMESVKRAMTRMEIL